MVSIGIVLFAKATLLTGGAAGLALLLQFATGADSSLLFFALIQRRLTSGLLSGAVKG